MKVLQERKPYETWKLQIDCNGLNWRQEGKVSCGSTLELTKNDILRREWFKYPDYEGLNYGFICPICGCFTEIKDELLPDGIKTLAKDYKTYKQI
jgi:hypothetical protein